MIKKVASSSQSNRVEELTTSTWWSRYHNHVYGAATILGLILTVIFFYVDKSSLIKQQPLDQAVGIVNQNLSSNTSKADKVAPSLPAIHEAQIAREAEQFSAITIEEYFDKWYHATELQRDEFEKQMLGKTIIWTGRIKNIESGNKGGVRVIVESPK